jgi:hypothetical protein
MKFRILIAAIFFVIPSLSYLSADIYRWTDSNGNVVYGNQPPANASDVKVMIRETPGRAGASSATQPDNSSSVETILKGVEEEKQGGEQPPEESGAAKPSAPPSREEMIALERAKLEKKIQDLEELPLEHFGSQKNKRVRIGYYQYRLETLLANPDNYFNNPEPFEGNIKTPSKSP